MKLTGTLLDFIWNVKQGGAPAKTEILWDLVLVGPLSFPARTGLQLAFLSSFSGKLAAAEKVVFTSCWRSCSDWIVLNIEML